MKSDSQLKKQLTGIVALCLMSSQVLANTVGIGIGRATDYPGSDNYVFSPNAAFELNTPIGTLKNNSVGAQLDIVKSTSLDSGPILRANFGRDNTVDNAAVAALPEVSPGAELGWFVNSGFRVDRLGIQSEAIVIGRLDAVTDVGDGHGGTQINGSVGLVLQLTDSFRLVPSIGFNYVDDNYAQAFYGVSSAGSAASGLDEFSASAGLEYTQAALYAVRTIDKNWSVTGTIAFNALQGDAAESPITNRGTADQLFTGFVVLYNF